MNAAIQFRRPVGRAYMRIIIRENALDCFPAIAPADVRAAPCTPAAKVSFHNNINQAAKIKHGWFKD